MMNNIPKPPEPQKVDNVPPKDVEKKKATFNNLFGLKWEQFVEWDDFR